MYVCLSACMYVCMYACMHACMQVIHPRGLWKRHLLLPRRECAPPANSPPRSAAASPPMCVDTLSPPLCVYTLSTLRATTYVCVHAKHSACHLNSPYCGVPPLPAARWSPLCASAVAFPAFFGGQGMYHYGRSPDSHANFCAGADDEVDSYVGNCDSVSAS